MMKGAIFDLDGTLLDSMSVWTSLATEFLKANGFTPKGDLNKIFSAFTTRQAAEYYKQHYPFIEDVDEIEQNIYHFVEEFYLFRVQPKKGVREYLEQLRKENVKMAIATATDSFYAESALKRLGVWDYFSALVTCKEVGKGKSFPDIFEETLKRLSLEKREVVVFEDSLHAIKTAKRAGFLVFCVYDESSHSDWEKIKMLSDGVAPFSLKD